MAFPPTPIASTNPGACNSREKPSRDCFAIITCPISSVSCTAAWTPNPPLPISTVACAISVNPCRAISRSPFVFSSTAKMPGNTTRASEARKQGRADAPTETALNLAFESLLAAEGSDWCWWFGPEHSTANDAEFDALYRKHLTAIYLALGQM